MRNLKVVKGNDFSIIVPLAQAVRDETGVTYSDLTLDRLVVSSVKFINTYSKEFDCVWHAGSDNISIKIDVGGNDLPVGKYDLEIVGVLDGDDIRATSKNVLFIVNSSQDSNLLADPVDMDAIPIPSTGPIDLTGNNDIIKYINRLLDSTLHNIDPYVREYFLSRLEDDTANGVITFLKKIFARGGAEFGNFVKGLYAGTGGAIDDRGNAEFESLRVRSYLEVLELVVNRLSALEGDQILTESDTIESVTRNDDGTYLLKLKEKYEGYFTAQHVNNVLKGIINTLPAHAQGITDVTRSDSEREGDSGTAYYYTSWMLIKAVDTVKNEITVALYPDEEVPAGRNFAPCKEMKIARWGNADDSKPELQSCLFLSSGDGKIIHLKRVNKPIIDFNNYGFTLGTIPEPLQNLLPRYANGDAVYVDTVYAQNFQKINKQHQPITEIVDRGQWTANPSEPYHFNGKNSGGTYETSTVYHIGCKWQCIHEGTSSEPVWNSTDWILIEGNSNLTLEFTDEEGYAITYLAVRPQHVDFTVFAKVFLGHIDITSDIRDQDVTWTIDRGTGYEDMDRAWSIAKSGHKSLRITNDDMPSTFAAGDKIKITCSILVRDGKFVTNEIII